MQCSTGTVRVLRHERSAFPACFLLRSSYRWLVSECRDGSATSRLSRQDGTEVIPQARVRVSINLRRTRPTPGPRRVALVHDRLEQYGGAERVLWAIHTIFPDAPIYTPFWNRQAVSAVEGCG